MLCVWMMLLGGLIFHCFCSAAGFTVSKLVTLIIGAIWDILLGINLIARFIFAPLFIIGFLICKYMTTQRNDNKEVIELSQQNLVPRRYSFADLVAITDHFKDKLGEGGYGTVYKGQLRGGCFVAVKMLVNSKFNEEDFTNEVSIIARIHHANVVQLLGFCSEGSHRALIYEYMPNGSLDNYISSAVELQPFSWEKLLQIALGTARGIEHLHGGCHVSILHFDIKPQNILLDQTFIPKVADFGLARFFPKDHDFVSISNARGTMGYIAPELLSRNLKAVSCKSDVYSYGMLLLEMVRARRIINPKGTCSSPSLMYFPSWIYENLNEGGDIGLENVSELDAVIARMLCVVGLWCVQKKALDRPSMTRVVEMLYSNIDSVQLPPNSLSFHHHDSSKLLESDSSTELLISETVERSS
uniref:Protein kinase domain-containing protein n=1 Tax=Rhizophora mucronata TaxID=61149 RepID=A0A2P2J8Y3_RHIMU